MLVTGSVDQGVSRVVDILRNGHFKVKTLFSVLAPVNRVFLAEMGSKTRKISPKTVPVARNGAKNGFATLV